MLNDQDDRHKRESVKFLFLSARNVSFGRDLRFHHTEKCTYNPVKEERG